MSFLADLFGGARRAAERDLERRLDVLRDELRSARAAGDTAAIAALPSRLPALGLSEDDAALELELIDGLLDVASMRAAAARGEGLPVVDTCHRALHGETCHFLAPAWRPDAADDSGGKLVFTLQRLLYLAAQSATLPWPHVALVAARDRDILVQTRPGRILTFRCNSYGDTLRGAWIAEAIRDRASGNPPGPRT